MRREQQPVVAWAGPEHTEIAQHPQDGVFHSLTLFAASGALFGLGRGVVN